ncbi:MAG: T9SS type A sorting domain-containing protein, partial [Cyclobacteriaceae bacterium]
GASVSPASVLYIGTERGHLYRTGNSTALNQISEITPTNFPTNGYISSIAVDPQNADRVIVAFSNYNVNSLFYSNNGGTTWQSISGNLESAGSTGGGAPSVRWVTMIPGGPGDNIYLLGTSVGLMSTDELNGNSTVWSREAVNTIGTIPVDMVRVRPIDGYIGVATHGNGIYEARIDVPLTAILQLVDIRCESGTSVLKSNVQFSGVENEFDLQYQWFYNGDAIPDLNSAAVSTTTEGRYQVRITNDITGESALSNEIIIDFNEANAQWCSGNPVTSVENDLEGLEIYPNPADQYLNIYHPFTGKVYMRVIDSNGRVLSEQDLDRSLERIDISSLTPGIYIIMLQHENNIISRKVIKK